VPFPAGASRLGRFKRAPGAPPNMPLQLTVTRPVMREYAQPGSRQQLNAGRWADQSESTTTMTTKGGIVGRGGGLVIWEARL
jgi:hypothetical protein